MRTIRWTLSTQSVSFRLALGRICHWIRLISKLFNVLQSALGSAKRCMIWQFQHFWMRVWWFLLGQSPARCWQTQSQSIQSTKTFSAPSSIRKQLDLLTTEPPQLTTYFLCSMRLRDLLRQSSERSLSKLALELCFRLSPSANTNDPNQLEWVNQIFGPDTFGTDSNAIKRIFNSFSRLTFNKVTSSDPIRPGLG